HQTHDRTPRPEPPPTAHDPKNHAEPPHHYGYAPTRHPPLRPTTLQSSRTVTSPTDKTRTNTTQPQPLRSSPTRGTGATINGSAGYPRRSRRASATWTDHHGWHLVVAVAILAGPVGPAPPPTSSCRSWWPRRCDPRRSRRASATARVAEITTRARR